MGFMLLPLLLLAGLLSTLDFGSGNDDEDSAGDDTLTADDSETLSGTAGNDILNALDTGTVYGHAGDDRLNLQDDARGLGGVGDDTIFAQDNSTGYGLDGDDSLTGSGNATISGGAGNDVLFASEQAEANGGAGDDSIYLQGTAAGNGGAGDDTLVVVGGSKGLTGGSGDDLFALDWSDLSSDYVSAAVTDFVAGQDKLAVLIGDRDLSELRFTVRQSTGTQGMLVEIDAGGDPEDTPMAFFFLEGVTAFDLNDVVLYGDDLNDPLDWTADPSWTETLTGGAGADSLTLNDSQVGFGEGGNDTLIASDYVLAYGGAGVDSLTGSHVTTLWGGEGNDNLTAIFAAEAYGESGDDTMLSLGNPQYVNQPSLYGGEGNDILSGDGLLDGGAGNDLLRPDADGSLFNGSDSYSGAVYGGAGDDTILGDSGAWELRGSASVEGGAGNDLIQIDQGGGIDAGAGNDVIITRLYDAVHSGDILTADGGVNPNYVRTTLGAGADILALDVLLTQEDVDGWSSDARSHVIADFNPAEDELALILPNADAGAFTASFTTNATTGFMELRLVNGISSMTLLLEGVTSAFPINDINIYADEAAVIARTPYATL